MYVYLYIIHVFTSKTVAAITYTENPRARPTHAQLLITYASECARLRLHQNYVALPQHNVRVSKPMVCVCMVLRFVCASLDCVWFRVTSRSLV